MKLKSDKERNEQLTAKLRKVLNYYKELFEYCKQEFDRTPEINIDDRKQVTFKCYVGAEENADKFAEKLNADALANYFPGESQKYRANDEGFSVKLEFFLNQVK